MNPNIVANVLNAYTNGSVSFEQVCAFLSSDASINDRPKTTKVPRQANYVASKGAKGSKAPKASSLASIARRAYPSKQVIHSDAWSISQGSPRYLIMRAALRRAEKAFAKAQGCYPCAYASEWWKEYTALCSELGITAQQSTFNVYKTTYNGTYWHSDIDQDDIRRQYYWTIGESK